MNVDNLMTVAQCDQCIASFNMIGMEVPPDLLARRKFLAEKGATVYADFKARNNGSSRFCNYLFCHSASPKG